MCDWNSGASPAATRSSESVDERAHEAVELVGGQWSVCSAMLTSYFSATTCANSASADARR